ncbi:hypothetical protein TNCV_4663411 [Trichonephila clavipes]|uniref:Uncharacterized protein n=1 Tax=Trichonephila clavipes TaxID=2585209 RepID=A0A8X6SDA8_TRICX|nr:hypothetical protein TNCV_4663411 [Trichonephila clavipes]
MITGSSATRAWKISQSIEESIRGRRFTTEEDIANAVRQKLTRFTYGEADGIQRLQHRWQSGATVAGDYIERL